MGSTAACRGREAAISLASRPGFSRVDPLDPAIEPFLESVRVLPRDWFMGICCGVRLLMSGCGGSGFPAAAAAAEAANSSASACQQLKWSISVNAKGDITRLKCFMRLWRFKITCCSRQWCACR